jgi:hypothetical protein
LRKEARNALVLALRADEAKCEAVVFLRDRDRDEERERAIREGVDRARAAFTSVAIAPGIVVECLEAWLLAIRGVKRTEAFSTSKAAAELVDCRNTAEMVALIETHGLKAMAPDATSLRAWCEEVGKALAPSEPASAT